MGDPVPSSAISDATVGGLSVIVVTGGADGDVLTRQSDGTYLPETPASGGIGGSVGSTDNRLVRSDGTGGSTVQSTGITVDDSNSITGVGSLTLSGNITHTGGTAFLATVLASGDIYLSGYNAYIALNGSGGSSTFDIRTQSTARIRNYANSAFAGLLVGSIVSDALICAGTYTVGTLPSASANAYKFATVSDSSVTTFGSTVAGSGSSKVMVFSNGTNWTVCAA